MAKNSPNRPAGTVRALDGVVRRSALTAVLASVALSAAACGGTDRSEGTAAASGTWQLDTSDCPAKATTKIKDTINLGSVIVQSGSPAASAFGPVADGLRAYVKYANEKNLLPGHELTIEIGDDQFDAAKTPAAVNRLLDDGADVIVGSMGTAGNLAVRNLLNEECVPQLFTFSGDPQFREIDEYPWTSSISSSYADESKTYADFFADKFGKSAKVGTFYANSESTVAYQKAFAERATDLGMKVVSEQSIEPTDAGKPTSQLAALAAARPDAILAVPLGAQCPVFLTELANAKAANPGWEPMVALTGACANSTILAPAGQAADGVISVLTNSIVDPTNPAYAKDPAVAEFTAFMKAEGYENSLIFGAQGWTAGELVVESIRQAAASEAGLTPASILEASRHLDFEPSLTPDGVRLTTDGAKDVSLQDALQIIQYNAKDAIFSPVGDLVPLSD